MECVSKTVFCKLKLPQLKKINKKIRDWEENILIYQEGGGNVNLVDEDKCIQTWFSETSVAPEPVNSPRLQMSRGAAPPGIVSIFKRAWAATVHKANPVIWQQICKRDKLRSCRGSNPASIPNRGFSRQRLKGLGAELLCMEPEWVDAFTLQLGRFCARILFSRIIQQFLSCATGYRAGLFRKGRARMWQKHFGYRSVIWVDGRRIKATRTSRSLGLWWEDSSSVASLCLRALPEIFCVSLTCVFYYVIKVFFNAT